MWGEVEGGACSCSPEPSLWVRRQLPHCPLWIEVLLDFWAALQETEPLEAALKGTLPGVCQLLEEEEGGWSAIILGETELGEGLVL